MPAEAMTQGITSQLAKWPETKTAGLPEVWIASSRSPLTISTRPNLGWNLAMCGNSKASRPRFSHWRSIRRARVAASMAGKAILKLRTTVFWEPVKGPSLRVRKPPMAEAVATGISPIRPVTST